MCQYFFIRLLDIIVFRREKKTFFANLPPEEGKHSLVELNGWGEGWGVGRENLTFFLK